MFDPFAHEDHTLDAEIARVHEHLTHFSAEDEEYQRAVDQLSKLYKLKHTMAQLRLQANNDFVEQQLAESNSSHKKQMDEAAQQLAEDANAWKEEQESIVWYKRVDPNTALTVAANLVIGIAVIKYEQTGVISTRVRDFMRKI